MEQLACRQAAACLCAAQVAGAVDRSAKGGRAKAAAQRHGVVGLLQKLFDLFGVGLRFKAESQLVRVGKRCLRCQSFQYLVKFECLIMSVHGSFMV